MSRNRYADQALERTKVSEDVQRLPPDSGTYITRSGMRKKDRILKGATDALERIEKQRFKMRKYAFVVSRRGSYGAPLDKDYLPVHNLLPTLFMQR